MLSEEAQVILAAISQVQSEYAGLTTYRTRVLASLDEIREHLKRLNGSVAKHEEQISEMLVRDGARDIACPHVEQLRAELALAREWMAKQQGANDTRQVQWTKYTPFLQPLVTGAIAALIALVLLHSGLFVPQQVIAPAHPAAAAAPLK